MHKNNKEPRPTVESRQQELLIGALRDAAANGGVWLNARRRTRPLPARSGKGVSASNSLILGLHSDRNSYGTNLYTSYTEAARDGEYVRGKARGVPINRYTWNRYARGDGPTDVIGRSQHLEKSPGEQKACKAVRRKETRYLWNIGQTILCLYDKPREEAGRQEEAVLSEEEDEESTLTGSGARKQSNEMRR